MTSACSSSTEPAGSSAAPGGLLRSLTRRRSEARRSRRSAGRARRARCAARRSARSGLRASAARRRRTRAGRRGTWGRCAPADLADAVAGAADALQPAGDRLRRLDLQHEVDGAHVDPELERAGGHEAGQLAGLQQLLDHGALLARERAVVRARDLARRDRAVADNRLLAGRGGPTPHLRPARRPAR